MTQNEMFEYLLIKRNVGSLHYSNMVNLGRYNELCKKLNGLCDAEREGLRSWVIENWM